MDYDEVNFTIVMILNIPHILILNKGGSTTLCSDLAGREAKGKRFLFWYFYTDCVSEV